MEHLIIHSSNVCKLNEYVFMKDEISKSVISDPLRWWVRTSECSLLRWLMVASGYGCALAGFFVWTVSGVHPAGRLAHLRLRLLLTEVCIQPSLGCSQPQPCLSGAMQTCGGQHLYLYSSDTLPHLPHLRWLVVVGTQGKLGIWARGDKEEGRRELGLEMRGKAVISQQTLTWHQTFGGNSYSNVDNFQARVQTMARSTLILSQVLVLSNSISQIQKGLTWDNSIIAPYYRVPKTTQIVRKNE